jgi:hypothetical protein
MLIFFKELPNIYIICFAFLFTLLVWAFVREREVLQIAISLGGALGGIAMKESKPSQTVNAETVENASVSNDQEKTDASQ